MAQVTSCSIEEGLTHLRGDDGLTLCRLKQHPPVIEGVLTCPECAKIALNAISLSTKNERKEWRKL